MARRSLRQAALAACIAGSLATAGAPAAAAANLLFNGSFEQTSAAPGAPPGLAGWTVVPDFSTTPPGSVVYGQASAVFASPVPLDDAASPGTDPVGLRGAYLVDDASPQAITQLAALPAGHYSAGFDYFVPTASPGAADATLWFKLEAGPLWQANLSTLPQGRWQHVGLNFSLAAPANLHLVFDVTPYGSAGQPALDVVIDRAFVTAVPEAPTVLMMLAGTLLLAGWRRPRHCAAKTTRESA